MKFDGNDVIHRRDELYESSGINLPLPILKPSNDLVCLYGHLSNIKQIAAYVPITGESFIDKDVIEKREKRLKIGAIIGALNNGLVSISAGMNRKRFEPEVPAVFISANLDEQPVQGWIGFAKFNEGDKVEVVAAKTDEHYEIYAITRPEDQIISILPSCEMGHKFFLRYLIRHYFQTVLPIMTLFFFLVITLFMKQSLKESLLITAAITLIAIPCLAWIVWNFYKDYKNGVYSFAEKIFNKLGWSNVENIDLCTQSMKIIRKKIVNKEFTQWTEADIAIRPSPYKKHAIKKGFFYYDKELDNNTK